MCSDLFLEEAPCGSILVSDHLVFAFWVVAYGRLDCIKKAVWLILPVAVQAIYFFI